MSKNDNYLEEIRNSVERTGGIQRCPDAIVQMYGRKIWYGQYTNPEAQHRPHVDVAICACEAPVPGNDVSGRCSDGHGRVIRHARDRSMRSASSTCAGRTGVPRELYGRVKSDGERGDSDSMAAKGKGEKRGVEEMESGSIKGEERTASNGQPNERAQGGCKGGRVGSRAARPRGPGAQARRKGSVPKRQRHGEHGRRVESARCTQPGQVKRAAWRGRARESSALEATHSQGGVNGGEMGGGSLQRIPGTTAWRVQPTHHRDNHRASAAGASQGQRQGGRVLGQRRKQDTRTQHMRAKRATHAGEKGNTSKEQRGEHGHVTRVAC
ncbi:hypothetical protein PYCCODRAFT_1429169 [Trametes coccinea BRFM310]|uniref:Uncharacterized protein n=1 Tax=Trametes coccinea (strain BRFM310) TaxID=1353009 RepID=A0A1Y2I599_TRAC3|nr:hypothetical protein PYCCODRAFT_1429169 [Trametes coccinea BRFM310]